jgi:hypothetical protein
MRVDIQDVRREALRAWIKASPEKNVTQFAAKWKLNQSHLSEMLAGKRVLGERAARNIERKAKIPPRHLEGLSGGTKEAAVPYHGILLTRAGAALGAEWEKLDIDRRAHFEQMIYSEVAKKIRSSRKAPPLRPVHDED